MAIKFIGNEVFASVSINGKHRIIRGNNIDEIFRKLEEILL
ncbi:hypothetical protein [Cetobacterium sp. 2A]|nr:hypothetical protein [Cetobacterium sp. 2A]